MNRKLILFMHGNLAKEFKETASLIWGSCVKDLIIDISNDGKSLMENVELLSKIINYNNRDKFILMTDFPGGSCYIASKIVAGDKEGINIITGVNLPMVFSFLSNYKKCDTQELIRLIKEEGKKSLEFS